MRFTRFLSVSLAGCAFAVGLSLSSPAAADNVTGAANAFSRAQKAELSGDYDTAAELYELADSLAPAPQALRSALKARKAAGQLRAAALHAEALLSRYPADARSKELAEETLKAAAASLSRYEIECRPSACGVAIDGTAAAPEPKEHHVIYVEAGHHEVVASFGELKAAPQAIEASPGFKGSVSFEAPPPPTPAAQGPSAPASVDLGVSADSGVMPSHGLSPWYFAAGAVVTVGLGAATVWSGLDTLSAHDDYKKHQTEAGYQDGLDKERRTNILIGGTAVAGVATAVLAYFTQWSSSSGSGSNGSGVRASAAVNVTPGGGFVSVGGTY